MSDAFTHRAYRAMLRLGLDAGYRFATFDQLDALRRSTDYACFLRHDCDNDLTAAAELARIEAELGVRSTYFVMTRSALYNVMAPPMLALVHEIAGLGHRIGLHFDEMPYRTRPATAIAGYADRERAWLSQELGVPVDVVSFHQPSPRVLANEVRLNCLNTYDRADMEGLYYVSDSNLRFRGKSPAELFTSREHRLLHILLHPEWWTETAISLDEKWNRMIANNVAVMQQSLLAREDTYNVPRTVTIETGDAGPRAET